MESGLKTILPEELMKDRNLNAVYPINLICALTQKMCILKFCVKNVTQFPTASGFCVNGLNE